MVATIQKTFRAMGTVNTISVYRREDEGALRRAAQRVLELDDRLSVFKAGSEIYRLNASAGRRAVPVSGDTLALLKTAKFFSSLSGGAFSITTRPLTALWSFVKTGGAVPDAPDLERAAGLVDDDDLILDESASSAMLLREGQAVDLGSIAKGFAADEARRVLAEDGVPEAIINLGGTVIPMGSPRTVGIQHPGKITGVPMGQLEIRNQAVVTSGSYERFSEADGVRYHHIMDPATGMPAVSGLLSVTAIGEKATELDALTTALFVMGMEKGAELARLRGAEVIFVTTELGVFCSSALRDRFSLSPIYANAR